MQRESLLSTDDEQTTKPIVDDAKKTTKRSTFEKHDDGRTTKKQKSPAEALESGLNAIKDGLVSLGNALASPAPAVPAVHEESASLNDVLKAIQDQSALMAQILNHMANSKQG
ncbi:hypothetical protein AC1031_012006 [Aphanomyces cochlioides]|nr:hypothetical protein AC1031_012006 [Aphanomyces cochlioides]